MNRKSHHQTRKSINAALTIATLIFTACGSDENSSTAELSEVNVAASGAGARVRYQYENAEPRIVNGRPVLDDAYWACVDSLTLTFPAAVRLPTLNGQVTISNNGNSKRALVIGKVSADGRTVELRGAEGRFCSARRFDRISVASGIRLLDDKPLRNELTFRLSFPAGRDSLPSSDANGLLQSFALNATWGAASPVPGCSGTSTQCFSVTPARLNDAFRAMQAWQIQEPNKIYYQRNQLQLLPLEGVIKPFAAANRRNHYGNEDLIYILRRAARFTQLLFPTMTTVPVADLSTASGETPSFDMGNDTVYAHPFGSHQHGRDADVAYITKGDGNNVSSGWHFERNFWFLYAALQSSSVDLVMTAYRPELTAMAQKALSAGLISSRAAGRFNMLMQDTGMNHDKHMHIAVGNDDNGGTSIKFLPTDDVYSCYLGLRPTQRGGDYNFCKK